MRERLTVAAGDGGVVELTRCVVGVLLMLLMLRG